MRIDFYLIEDKVSQANWLFACRLLEKAYLRKHQVFVWCNHAKDAELLDELLWTFKEDSFIPHNLQGEGPEPPPPVHIGYDKEPRGFNDILLNMTETIPPFYTRFQRIIEIVEPNEVTKTISREHYRWYKQQGCELYTHNMAVSIMPQISNTLEDTLPTT